MFLIKECVHSSPNFKTVLQIPEEEKDPVYKYFESMMTCARVREFNAKPPQVSNLPEIFNTATSTVKEKKTVDDSPKAYFRTLNDHNNKEGKEWKKSASKNS